VIYIGVTHYVRSTTEKLALVIYVGVKQNVSSTAGKLVMILTPLVLCMHTADYKH